MGYILRIATSQTSNTYKSIGFVIRLTFNELQNRIRLSAYATCVTYLLLQFLVECTGSTQQQFTSVLAFSRLPPFTEDFQCQAIELINSNSRPIYFWYFIFQDPWDKNQGARAILEKPFWWWPVSSELISKELNSLLLVTVANAISCQRRIHKSSEKSSDWHWTPITEWSTTFPYWPTIGPL